MGARVAPICSVVIALTTAMLENFPFPQECISQDPTGLLFSRVGLLLASSATVVSAGIGRLLQMFCDVLWNGEKESQAVSVNGDYLCDFSASKYAEERY